MSQQLNFNFQKSVCNFTQEDFIQHQGNQIAYKYLMETTWHSPITCLVGFKHTGKTYLLNLWSKKEQAFSINPDLFKDSSLKSIPSFYNQTQNFSIDNLECFLLKDAYEENLFHLYNHCIENNKKLLITSSDKPANLKFIFPDLASRLKSIPTLLLESPSLNEKKIFIIKYFSDFQVSPDMAIVEYIKLYGPQCLNHLSDLIERICDHSLSEKRKVTITLVKEVLITLKKSN